VKHSLGKLLLFLLLTYSASYAEDFVYDFHTNTSTPYVKESVLLSVDIDQTNPDIVLFFQFQVAKSDAYEVEQVNSSQDLSLYHSKIHYRYLLHPLRSGDLNVSFNLVKRVTNAEKVAYSFSGDRDDFKKLETINSTIDIPPIELHVKPLPKKDEIVGDFNLSYEIKRTQAEAYEPLPLRIILQGRGYPPIIDNIIPKNETYTLFSQDPVVEKQLSPQGIHYKVTYTLALSAIKSFDLPVIRLDAFNPKTETSYVLSIPSTHFDIKQPNSDVLVDTINHPSALKANFSWVRTLLTYLLIFIAGYLSALSWSWGKKKKETSQHPLVAKITHAKDDKALLQVLISVQNNTFASTVKKIETNLYGNTSYPLKKLKQDALEKIK